VKPPPFEYTRAETLGHALEVLGADADAKLLAGGQSLIPMLNLRLARPSRLVDINYVPELDYIKLDERGLRLGSLVRHTQLLASANVAADVPLLIQAARHIGHVAIRNRGTCGGSVAHADPAAELPLALVALEATFHLTSRSGARVVPATEFFQGAYSTVLRDDEMIVEIVVPPRRTGERSAFLELTVREGDFAIVAIAALGHASDGRLSGVRVVWSGADFLPVVADTTHLRDEPIESNAIEPIVNEMVRELAPPDDIRGSGEYRREALRALTARALLALTQRGRTQDG
jgi:carbon-monoxide dehydrogenase medium subunit